MRDAVELKGKKIHYNNENYKIDSFHLIPKTGAVYVRLIKNKMFLNVSLLNILELLKDQIKL